MTPGGPVPRVTDSARRRSRVVVVCQRAGDAPAHFGARKIAPDTGPLKFVQ